MRYAAIYLAVIVILLSVLLVTKNFITQWSTTKRNYSEPIAFTLERGQSLKTLAKNLESSNIIKPAWFFELWVRFKSDYGKFQAGNYQVQGELSVQDLVEMMINGNTYDQVVFSILVPEGFTLKQIAERISAAGLASSRDVINAGQDYSLLQELKLQGDSVEGYLFPAFYNFYSTPSVEDILRKMVATFRQRLPADYEIRAQEKGLSLHQAVTFASLIEAETPHDRERPLISEVIWNRLKARMALGIDAAIIYGVADYDGNLRFKDLQDRSNPYNTRIHIGLPPGPIGSPSSKSLQAVLEPSNLGNYYYVIDVPTREHYFSKDLKEHNSRVRKMLNDFAIQEQADKLNSQTDSNNEAIQQQ